MANQMAPDFTGAIAFIYEAGNTRALVAVNAYGSGRR